MKRIILSALLLTGAIAMVSYGVSASSSTDSSEPHATSFDKPAVPSPRWEPPTYATAHTPPPRHMAFDVAPLPTAGSKLKDSDWQPSSDIIPRAEVTVFIVASWCPHSVTLIKKLNSDSSLKARVDMVLVYENEAEAYVDYAVREGEVTKEKGEKIKRVLAQRGQFLLNPEALEGSLPYHVIKKGQFDDIVAGYPSAIRCTSRGCKAIERPDL